MNNVQKAFKTKSKLRCMADGGQVDPHVLGSGMAQRAGSALQGRRAQLDAAIDAASGDPPPARPTSTPATPATTTATPTPTAAAPAKKPEGKNALRSFFGLADGGSPADVDRVMNSRDMSIFTPQEMKTFNGMGQAAMTNAAQMQDMGAKAGQQATDMGLSAATQPQFAPPADDMAAPEQELADGGKVKGKGGPTDDKVGPVALSDGEYVLPADTVDIVGRDKLDALRLATHDFVDDSNKPKVSGLRKMANGGEVNNPYMRDAIMRAANAGGDSSAANATLRSGGVAAYDAGLAGARQRVGNFLTSGASSGATLNPFGTAATREATLAQMGNARSAINMGGGRTAGLVRGVLPAAAIGGVVDSFADTGSGYRDKFNESVGATGPISSGVGDVARVANNVGNAVTFGLAGRLGRGLSNLTSGQSFTEGFMSESDRDRYNRENPAGVMGRSASGAAGQPTVATQSRPGELPGMSNVPADVRTSSAGTPAVPVQPQSYQSRRLAEMGAPVGQQNLAPVTDDTRRSLLREGGGTPGQYVNLGSYGGDANIYGTASKPGGRINSFVGVGTSSRPGGGPQEDPIMGEIRSALRGLTDGAGGRGSGGGGGGATSGGGNASDINARYDNLASQLRGMYGPKGQGNLARRLLELEQSRSGALDADARNQSTLRGQDMHAATAANSANLHARMQALQTLGNMANQRGLQSAQAQAAQLKALQDAQKTGFEREEKGFERYNGAIRSMFIGPDGKPDAAEQERFTSFLQASDPQAREKFAAMSPQDQMVLLQNFKTLYDMNKARNATATGGVMNSGAVTNRADMPVDVRESTWNDVWNNHLPVSDYLYSNLLFTNPNVVVTQSGQPVLMSDYATTGGNWDADKLELIRQRTGKNQNARSALRGK